MSNDEVNVGAIAKEYFAAFSKAETHLKNAELFCQRKKKEHGLLFPAVNELRYAGFHAARAVTEALTEGEKVVEYEKAISHCRRSSYDSLDAVFQFLVMACRTFQADYSRVVISTVVKDYLEQCVRLMEINDGLWRQPDDKETRWQYMETNLDEVMAIANCWEIAREELNKIQKEERNRRWRETLAMVGVIATVIGAVAAIVAFFNKF
jgi:hypothetical protein